MSFLLESRLELRIEPGSLLFVLREQDEAEPGAPRALQDE